MERVFGTAQLDGHYGAFRDTSEIFSARALLRAASDSGFDVLDTAPAYRGAEVEIGEYGWPGQIHTKIAAGIPPLDSLRESLNLLKRQSVEVLYFHNPGVLLSSVELFKRVRDELPRSKANLLGVSIYTPAEMKLALEIPQLEALQIPLNLADGRFDLGLLEQAKFQGVRVYARSVFLQGLLLQDDDRVPEKLAPLRAVVKELSAVVAETERSRLETVIGWVRALPGVHGIVLGAETQTQVAQLGQALNAPPLGDEALARLRRVQVTVADFVDPRRW